MNEVLLVLIGSVLGIIANVVMRRLELRRQRRTAAAMCYDRISKIAAAIEVGDSKRRDDEVRRLGADLDRFLASIAASTGIESPEWQLYEEMKHRVLEGHDYSALEDLGRKVRAHA